MSVNVVFFCYAFPPFPSPRSIQISHLARKTKHTIKIICASETKSVDSSLLELVPSSLKIYRFHRRMKLPYQLQMKLPAWTRFPDTRVHWARRTERKVRSKKLISSSDTLITFGHPMSNHLAGYSLKKRLKLPWIAHFSDPWVDNPYFHLSYSARLKTADWERKVIETADCLIFTSEETRNLVMSRYPKTSFDKAKVLSHCFDPSLYKVSNSRRNESDNKIVFRYLGRFYGIRSANKFIEGIRFFIGKFPLLKKRVKFEMIGGEIPKSKLIGIEDIFEVRPRVPYIRSLQLMIESDVLVIIDANMKENIFFPAKLADYIGSNRTILGVTPPGTSARVITQLGGEVAHPDKPEEIANKIASLVSSRNETNETLNKARDLYSISSVTEQFDLIVTEVSEQRKQTECQ